MQRSYRACTYQRSSFLQAYCRVFRKERYKWYIRRIHVLFHKTFSIYKLDLLCKYQTFAPTNIALLFSVSFHQQTIVSVTYYYYYVWGIRFSPLCELFVMKAHEEEDKRFGIRNASPVLMDFRGVLCAKTSDPVCFQCVVVVVIYASAIIVAVWFNLEDASARRDCTTR